jgi:hypothetical protein
MKALLLYATTNTDKFVGCNDYQPFRLSGERHRYIYIRAEEIEVQGLIQTLDHANPRDGEVFLNGINIDTPSLV